VEDVRVLSPEGSSSPLYGAGRAYIDNPCQILNFDRALMFFEHQLALCTLFFCTRFSTSKGYESGRALVCAWHVHKILMNIIR